MGWRIWKEFKIFCESWKKCWTKTISQLKNNNYYIKTNQSNILNQIKDFYQHLYKKYENVENCENSTFFRKKITTMEQNHGDEQSGHLSKYECGIALKEMKSNKRPGSDVLTADFYKLFWNDIKQYLVKSLNYPYYNKNLTELQKQSIITLLPKKDKDTLSINNWRPISFLNVDYKIASKVIANKKNEIANYY